MNNAAMNIRVQVCGREFSVLLGRYLGMELLSHMVLRVEHFEELPSCFQSSCTILHSCQQGLRVLLFSCSHQHVICLFDGARRSLKQLLIQEVGFYEKD